MTADEKMGATADPSYAGQRLGTSREWQQLDPIDDDDLGVLVKALSRPGGRLTWPKNSLAALVLRLWRAEHA